MMIQIAAHSNLLTFAAYLVLAGVIAGFLAGVFGIGGGAVIVPVLYQIFGLLHVDETVRMHLAVGSSLAIIVPTSLRSLLSHHRRGAVDLDLLKSFLVPIPLGSVAASLAAASISSAGLRATFAAIAVIFGLKLIFGRHDWRLGDKVPTNPIRFVVAALIGFFSTLIGIGGGVLNNTFMTLYGRPMHQAIATSAGVGALISIPGLVGYVLAGWGDPLLPPLSTGFVNWIAVLVVIPLTLATAPLGVRAAHALDRRRLETGFGCFMLLVAARFAWSLA